MVARRILNMGDIRERIREAPEGLSMAALGGLLATIVPEARGMNLLARGIHAERKRPWALTAVLAAALAAVGLFLLVSQLTLGRVQKSTTIDLHKGVRANPSSAVEASRPTSPRLPLQGASRCPGDLRADGGHAEELLAVEGAHYRQRPDLEGTPQRRRISCPLLEASPYFRKVSSRRRRCARGLNAERLIRMGGGLKRMAGTVKNSNSSWRPPAAVVLLVLVIYQWLPAPREIGHTRGTVR
jgi:hypothetical protein